MRITGGSTGLAIVAIGGYLAWRAMQPHGSPAAGHIIGPVGTPRAPLAYGGPAGPTQGQLQTQGPYSGGPGPGGNGGNFSSVPGVSCVNCGDDAGQVALRSPVASAAWAGHWGVTPQDTTGSGRGVPYP